VVVRKKQKKVDGGDGDADRHGDCWIYIAKKADTKLHLAHSTGKRVQATADKLMETVRKRGTRPTEDEKATFISDGNDQYINAILDNFEAGQEKLVLFQVQRDVGQPFRRVSVL